MRPVARDLSRPCAEMASGRSRRERETTPKIRSSRSAVFNNGSPSPSRLCVHGLDVKSTTTERKINELVAGAWRARAHDTHMAELRAVGTSTWDARMVGSRCIFGAHRRCSGRLEREHANSPAQTHAQCLGREAYVQTLQALGLPDLTQALKSRFADEHRIRLRHSSGCSGWPTFCRGSELGLHPRLDHVKRVVAARCSDARHETKEESAGGPRSAESCCSAPRKKPPAGETSDVASASMQSRRSSRWSCAIWLRAVRSSAPERPRLEGRLERTDGAAVTAEVLACLQPHLDHLKWRHHEGLERAGQNPAYRHAALHCLQASAGGVAPHPRTTRTWRIALASLRQARVAPPRTAVDATLADER